MSNPSTQLYIPGNVDLSGVALALRTKDAREVVSYSMDFHSRMDPYDKITSASITPNDPSLVISGVTCAGTHIACTISGGTTNTYSGITVQYTTAMGDVRTLAIGLMIAPQGLANVAPPIAFPVPLTTIQFAALATAWLATLPETAPAAGGPWLDGGLLGVATPTS